MNTPLDAFLERCGLAAPDSVSHWTALAGGVSSDIWRVDLAGGRSICVKRALAKLKVAADWSAPVSRNAFEWAWMRFAEKTLPGSVPRPLAHDPDAGLFAMEFLPAADYPLWKGQLLAGHVESATAAGVGARLGRLHAASAHREDLRREFDTTSSFHALRLEPYLLAAAVRHPAAAGTLRNLAAVTAGTRMALVHGDVSPKNILVGRDGAVFLDAECAWYGDPAFDVAFCLNHLVLKSIVVPARRLELQQSVEAFVAAYFEAAAAMDSRAALEGRAAALLPALLLARVDGKSPVEYVTAESQKQSVRDVALALLMWPARNLVEVAEFTLRGLARP
jgi:Ser/Thr protein kinase RdoA (MazF antagonist)